MTTDRDRWDARYREAAIEWQDPDPQVCAALARLGPGNGRPALDLASGRGRHSLEMARRGWTIEAWDVSPVGLECLARHAAERGLVVGTREVDLSTRPLPAARCDLLLVVDFLDRSLFDELAALVRVAGHVLIATFTVDWRQPRPPPAFRLERGELARGIPGFESIDQLEQGGRALLLARRTG